MRLLVLLLGCMILESHGGGTRSREEQLNSQKRTHVLAVLKQMRLKGRLAAPTAMSVLAHLLTTFDPASGWQIFNAGHQRNVATVIASNSCSRSRQSLLVTQDVLDLQRVVETLKSDMPDLLRREPTWEILAEEGFKVVDKTGTGLDGLGPTKLLLKLFRRMCEVFEVKDNINVDFVSGDQSLDVDPFVTARWKVQLGSQKASLFKSFNAELLDPLDIEADTVFHLNDKRQVDYMQINKWLVNGQQFELFPRVQLSEDPAENFKMLRQWATSIKALQPELSSSGDDGPLSGDRRKVLLALLLSLGDDVLAVLCVGGGGAKGGDAVSQLTKRKVTQTHRGRLRGRRMLPGIPFWESSDEMDI